MKILRFKIDAHLEVFENVPTNVTKRWCVQTPSHCVACSQLVAVDDDDILLRLPSSRTHGLCPAANTKQAAGTTVAAAAVVVAETRARWSVYKQVTVRV